jgi:hypothetical protein
MIKKLKVDNIIACDRKGAIHETGAIHEKCDYLNEAKQCFA